MNNRIDKLIRGFRKSEDGAIAVEFAFVAPILAGLFLASLDLGSVGFTQNKLSSSLRFSAQYVANGGTDLNVAKNVFARSYGQYDSFSSTVSCSCALSRGSLDDKSGEADVPTTVNEDLGSVSGSTKDAPQCTKSCGESTTVRYLTLSARVSSKPILGTEITKVSNSVSVRLK